MAAPPPDKPIYAYITIDLLIHILNRSIFHPFIAWLIPLCLRAVETPSTAPRYLYSIYWAVFITAFSAFNLVSRKIAYGAAREVDWDDEVVVITGGAGGLGRLMAEVYGMRGISVAVLDVKRPDNWEELQGVEFYECDVGDMGSVKAAKEKVEKELGPPTIVINNAGIATPGSLLDVNAEDVERTIRVNLLGSFHTIQAFLPGMLREERGTIVTVSSVLGHLGCANLSAYTASKAALRTLHASLRAELSHSEDPAARNINTILVTPGQLATPMFASVKTPSSFLAPIVAPTDVAKEIMRFIDEGESGVVSMPFYSRWIEWLAVLPVGVQSIVRRLSGVDTAMGIGLTKAKQEGASQGAGMLDEKSPL